VAFKISPFYHLYFWLNSPLLDRSEELLEMIALVVEELEFVCALLLFIFASLTGPCLDSLNLALELDHFVLLFLLLGFQLLNLLLQVCLAMFRLQLLPHGESHRGLVQGLVCCNGHFDLISHSEEE